MPRPRRIRRLVRRLVRARRRDRPRLARRLARRLRRLRANRRGGPSRHLPPSPRVPQGTRRVEVGEWVTATFANSAFQVPRDQALVRYLVKHFDTQILLMCEFHRAGRAMRLGPLLAHESVPGAWRVFQDEGKEPGAVPVAVRAGTPVDVTEHAARLATHGGNGVGARYTKVVTVTGADDSRVHLAAAHSPLRATGKQDEFFDHLDDLTSAWTAAGDLWAVSLDGNTSVEWMARRLGGRAYGRGKDAFICHPALAVRNLRVDTTHTERSPDPTRLMDHPAVSVEIFLPTPAKPVDAER